jgi:hypothetical protein
MKKKEGKECREKLFFFSRMRRREKKKKRQIDDEATERKEMKDVRYRE